MAEPRDLQPRGEGPQIIEMRTRRPPGETRDARAGCGQHALPLDLAEREEPQGRVDEENCR